MYGKNISNILIQLTAVHPDIRHIMIFGELTTRPPPAPPLKLSSLFYIMGEIIDIIMLLILLTRQSSVLAEVSSFENNFNRHTFPWQKQIKKTKEVNEIKKLSK